jgi:hypothetical protein
MLTLNRLKEVLQYDPKTGVLTWKVRLSSRGQKGFVGTLAGCVVPSERNRIVIGIDGRQYLAHGTL